MYKKLQYCCIVGLACIMTLVPLRIMADPFSQHVIMETTAQLRLEQELIPYEQRDIVLNNYMNRDSILYNKIYRDIEKRNYQLAIKYELKRIETDRKIVLESAHYSKAVNASAFGLLFETCDELGELYEYKRDYVHALMFYCAPWFYRNTGELPTDFSLVSDETIRLMNMRAPLNYTDLVTFAPGFGYSSPTDAYYAGICYYHLGNYGMAALASANDESASQVQALFQKLNAANVWKLPSNEARQAAGGDQSYLKTLIDAGWIDFMGERLALRHLKKAAQLDPGNVKIWDYLGDIYSSGLDNNDTSLKDYLNFLAVSKHAARLDPTNAEYWYDIGDAYEMIDNIKMLHPMTSQEFKQGIQDAQSAISAYKDSIKLKKDYYIWKLIVGLKMNIKAWQKEYLLSTTMRKRQPIRSTN